VSLRHRGVARTLTISHQLIRPCAAGLMSLAGLSGV